MEIATFGGGCFWCTEAIFSRLIGVHSVTPGYSGGSTEQPTYEQVSSESTGHAEVVQIEFDPSALSYKTLLEVFFATHDPTTLNRQGADTGEQYRSIIFYHSEEQRKEAEEYVHKLGESGTYSDPIVTEIVPFEKFYEAEDYHMDYYERNRDKNPYCFAVIDPKIKKLLKEHSSLVSAEYKKSA